MLLPGAAMLMVSFAWKTGEKATWLLRSRSLSLLQKSETRSHRAKMTDPVDTGMSPARVSEAAFHQATKGQIVVQYQEFRIVGDYCAARCGALQPVPKSDTTGHIQ